MQIIPGVYLINGFPYGQHQNGYCIKTGDAQVLIDSGDLETPTLPLVERNCERWGIDIARSSHLLITHSHFDHSSHAARLQKNGTNIVCSRPCADALAAGDDRCVGFAAHGRFEPCTADRIVDDGEVFTVGSLRFTCMSAPGHADSSIVPDNPQRHGFMVCGRHYHDGA